MNLELDQSRYGCGDALVLLTILTFEAFDVIFGHSVSPLADNILSARGAQSLAPQNANVPRPGTDKILSAKGEIRMVTKADISYELFGTGKVSIPEGTPVIPADNLPDGGWWVEPWEDMSKLAESWERNYGFLLRDDEVTDES
jgi:hypothetical protein